MTRPPVELETPRLRLRQWRDSDLEPFSEMNGDPRVMEFFLATQSRSESDAAAARIRESFREHGFGFWAVEVVGVSSFIGFVGLQHTPSHIPVSPRVEIGWRLAAAHWGRGYASEGARAALRAGFEVFGLDEIVSFTATVNVRSRAVMERIGMQFAGETFEHPNVPAGNPLRLHVVYRLQRRR